MIRLFILCGFILTFTGCSEIHSAHAPVSPITHKEKHPVQKKTIRRINLGIHGIEQKEHSFYWCAKCPIVTPKTIHKSKISSQPMTSTVYFDFNKFDLSIKAKATLLKFVTNINSQNVRGLSIHIDAYTDSVSNKSINKLLAKKRALAIQNFLKKIINHTVVDYQIFARGKCCFVQTPTDSWRNRRAVITVTKRR